MLENLLQLVTQNAGNAIVNNNAIPNQHNDAAIQDVTQSIFNGLQQQVQSGNHQGLLSLLSGQSGVQGNPIVNAITQNAAGSLMQKFGVENAAAQQAVQQLLPVVMNQLVSKTNNPQDNSFDIGGIVNSLTGGNVPGDLGGLVSQFTGGQQQQGGGIMGALGKLFGR
jgi:uncharacterized protein YidB (DUF937 family)